MEAKEISTFLKSIVTRDLPGGKRILIINMRALYLHDIILQNA